MDNSVKRRETWADNRGKKKGVEVIEDVYLSEPEQGLAALRPHETTTSIPTQLS